MDKEGFESAFVTFLSFMVSPNDHLKPVVLFVQVS